MAQVEVPQPRSRIEVGSEGIGEKMSLPLKVRRNSSCCLSKRFASGASFGKVYVLSVSAAIVNVLVR